MSARELSRRMSRLLDEIESDGSALVVLRYGRPSAVLIPFREAAGRPILPRIADIGSTHAARDAQEVPDFDPLDLDEHQRRIVREIATCTFLHWTPGLLDMPVPELARALVSLEMLDLVERGPGASRHLTARRERLARRLDSEA